MNLLKSTTISCLIILSVTLLLLIVHLLTKKFRSKLNDNGRLKISFGIWYAALFIAGGNIISVIIYTVLETIDNLTKIQPAKFYLELIKTTTLVVGIGFLWFLLWFMIVQFLIKTVLPKFNENDEMDDDSFSYFLIKGSMILALILGLSPILTLILRSFIPTINTPFYH